MVAKETDGVRGSATASQAALDARKAAEHAGCLLCGAVLAVARDLRAAGVHERVAVGAVAVAGPDAVAVRIGPVGGQRVAVVVAAVAGRLGVGREGERVAVVAVAVAGPDAVAVRVGPVGGQRVAVVVAVVAGRLGVAREGERVAVGAVGAVVDPVAVAVPRVGSQRIAVVVRAVARDLGGIRVDERGLVVAVAAAGGPAVPVAVEPLVGQAVEVVVEAVADLGRDDAAAPVRRVGAPVGAAVRRVAGVAGSAVTFVAVAVRTVVPIAGACVAGVAVAPAVRRDPAAVGRVARLVPVAAAAAAVAAAVAARGVAALDRVARRRVGPGRPAVSRQPGVAGGGAAVAVAAVRGRGPARTVAGDGEQQRLSAELNRARNPAYHLWGGTALAEADVALGRGWSTRVRLSVGLDWYPDSAAAPEFGTGAEARRDVLLRPALAFWTPRWSGVRLGLAYEPSWQLSTAPAYEFVDHRALLYVRWTAKGDPWRPEAVAGAGRVALPHGFAAGPGGEESLSDRIRELLRQDEEAQRASTCVD